MKQPLSIVRGTTLALGLTVYTLDGEEYTLSSGEVLRFGVKKNTDDSNYMIIKNAGPTDTDSNGKYVFEITPDDTSACSFGCYYYDIGLQSGDDYYNVIELSEFRIVPNITKREG